MVGLRGIFDTCKEAVFIDNWRIKDKHQDVVAKEIYNTLVLKKWLS